MSDTVTVQMSHPWTDPDGKEHTVGDRVPVDPETARLLIRSGHAVPATVPDAKAVNQPPEAAATKKEA